MACNTPKLFSQEDEVQLLEEYYEFMKLHGENVRNKFVEFLKTSALEERYNSKQISKKVRGLKKRYENQKMNNSSPPQHPNKARLFHVSESLWGKPKAPVDSDLLPLADASESSLNSSSKSKSKTTAWEDLRLKELELYAQQLALQIRACELHLQQFISDSDDTSTIMAESKRRKKKKHSLKLPTDNSSASDYDVELLNDIPQEQHHVEQQRYLPSCEGVEKDVVDDGNTSYIVELLRTDECQSNEKKSRNKKGKKRKAGNLETDPTTSKELQTLESGVVIEEVVAGDPNKKAASKGLQVKIYFTGKVKNSGHVIESTNNNPHIICLGSKELIDGFSKGVEGMRVGGKRKLIIPPSMGFGDKGFGEIVPPNSWLEYEVELLGVRHAASNRARLAS